MSVQCPDSAKTFWNDSKQWHMNIYIQCWITIKEHTLHTILNIPSSQLLFKKMLLMTVDWFWTWEEACHILHSMIAQRLVSMIPQTMWITFTWREIEGLPSIDETGFIRHCYCHLSKTHLNFMPLSQHLDMCKVWSVCIPQFLFSHRKIRWWPAPQKWTCLLREVPWLMKR